MNLSLKNGKIAMKDSHIWWDASGVRHQKSYEIYENYIINKKKLIKQNFQQN